MKLPLISAGEFFELLRPAAFALSAMLSIWVLASAQRSGIRAYWGLVWALATFFLPVVVLPIYLLVRSSFQRKARDSHSVGSVESEITERAVPAEAPKRKDRMGLVALVAYGLLLLGATGLYLYRDHNSVDAHLARATQAKLSSQPVNTIREYRAALALEDNPHTHKLLGVELAEAQQWAEALNEFRLAEKGGEPDELLPFKIAQALDGTGAHAEAAVQYRRFLASGACVQELPNDSCEPARKRALGRTR